MFVVAANIRLQQIRQDSLHWSDRVSSAWEIICRGYYESGYYDLIILMEDHGGRKKRRQLKKKLFLLVLLGMFTES